MHITSLQNPRIQHIARLLRDRRQRTRDGLMLVEGRDEIRLAVAAGHQPRIVVAMGEGAVEPFGAAGAELITVEASVFTKLSYRENPDGWLAVFPIPEAGLGTLQLTANPLIVVAEGIEKPGNLGAILRTADAAGVDAVLVSNPRADLYSPNVVRASRGALFTIPTAQISGAEALTYLLSHGIRIVAATPTAPSAYTTVDLRGPLAIAVGTEDKGLSSSWLSAANSEVRIPMVGRVNSLNLSVATALLVYEALRQRAKIL